MSTKNSNKLNVPEAKAAMDQFKMEAASEVGVNLKKPVFEVERSCLKQVYLCRGHSSHSCHRSGLVTISICLHLAQAVS